MPDIAYLPSRVDRSTEPPDNGDVEQRLAALEKAVGDLPTKADFAGLRADMAEAGRDLHKAIAENHRWTHTALVAVITLMVLGIGGFLFTMYSAVNKPTVAAPAYTPPPIIINVPGTPGPAPVAAANPAR